MGNEHSSTPTARMQQLVGKLTSVEQHKAAARSACLRVDPSTTYNKAQAAMKGTEDAIPPSSPLPPPPPPPPRGQPCRPWARHFDEPSRQCEGYLGCHF